MKPAEQHYKTRSQNYLSNDQDTALKADEGGARSPGKGAGKGFDFHRVKESMDLKKEINFPGGQKALDASDITGNSQRKKPSRKMYLKKTTENFLRERGIDLNEELKEAAESFLELSLHQDSAEVDKSERAIMEELAEKLPQRVKDLLKEHLQDTRAMNAQIEEEEMMNKQLILCDPEEREESSEKVENKVEQKASKFIIMANSTFRLRWDLFIILLVIYNCISIPLEIAFPESSESQAAVVISALIDLAFAFDIGFNFVTTYVNEKTGLEVIECRAISKNYVKQWRFWVDLLATIPFEVLYNLFAGGANSEFNFSLFDLLKLIRLLRLGRIISYLKVKQDVKVGFRIVQLLSFLLLLVHWVGCMWYIMVRDGAWIPPMDLDSGETIFYKVGNGYRYSTVFYYAILLLVGNEAAPTTLGQTIFASMVVIMGSITTAFIFGNMAALMAAMNQKDQQFQEQYDKIMSLMRSIQLPEEVQEEVDSYLLHIQQVPDLQQDMEKFLNLLSPALKSQILFHMYKSIIRKIKIFDTCSDIELRFIVTNLKTVIFLPNDEIVRQGDSGDNLYFISRGSVDVFIKSDEQIVSEYDSTHKKSIAAAANAAASASAKDNASNNAAGVDIPPAEAPPESNKSEAGSQLAIELKPIKQLHEGSYFGEISLMTSLKRTATIKAKEFCTLGFLTKKVFVSAKTEFPQIWRSFKANIKEEYKDSNFEFRKSIIKNVPYFKSLSSSIIQELLYLMKPERLDPNTLLIKRGDSTDKIYFIKFGKVDIEVPLKNGRLYFDTLNSGSCLCIYSAFHEERKQKFDFRCKTACSIEVIRAADILQLEKEQLELSDELRALRAKIENNEKTGFDFYRFVPPNMVGAKLDQEKKTLLRKKMRIAITNFGRQFRKKQKMDGPSDDALKTDFKALHALGELEKERSKKEEKLGYLQQKSSGAFMLKNMGKKDKDQEEKKNKDGNKEMDKKLNKLKKEQQKVDIKNFDMSQSFIHQSQDDIQLHISAANPENEEEEKDQFFHNDNRLRYEQVHDKNVFKNTGYVDNLKGKEGVEYSVGNNASNAFQTVNSQQNTVPAATSSLFLKQKTNQTKNSEPLLSGKSKTNQTYESSLKGELNSRPAMIPGDATPPPLMGGGPGMHEAASSGEKRGLTSSSKNQDASLFDKTKNDDSHVSEGLPLISHQRSYSKFAAQRPNIVSEMVDHDARAFMNKQRAGNDVKDHSNLSSFVDASNQSKCPYIQRQFADYSNSRDTSMHQESQGARQTKKFMSGARFEKNPSIPTGFASEDDEPEQSLPKSQKNLFAGFVSPQKSRKSSIKIGASQSEVRQDIQPAGGVPKPLAASMVDPPVKAQTSAAGTSSLGEALRKAKEDKKRQEQSAAGSSSLGEALKKAKEDKRRREEEEKNADAGQQNKSENSAPPGGLGGLGALLGGGGGSSAPAGGGIFGGGMQNKLFSGIKKNIVGSESDIQIIQMLGIINKSIQAQQEQVGNLAKVMGKKFKTLDAKLNQIQVQKAMEINGGYNYSSHHTTSDIKSESYDQGNQLPKKTPINLSKEYRNSGVSLKGPPSNDLSYSKMIESPKSPQIQDGSKAPVKPQQVKSSFQQHKEQQAHFSQHYQEQYLQQHPPDESKMSFQDDEDDLQTSNGEAQIGPKIYRPPQKLASLNGTQEDNENVLTDQDQYKPFFTNDLRQKPYLSTLSQQTRQATQQNDATVFKNNRI